MEEGNSSQQQGWVYDNSDPAGSNPQSFEEKSVSWTASEFIAHEKDTNWFVMMGLAAGVIVILTFLITRDLVSTIVVLVMLVIFAVFANRKPRILPYQVDMVGVHIGDKTYPYDELKTFSLIQEDGVRSINIVPLKRFLPPISIYMDPEDEDKIIDVLSSYLPFEQREQELVDRLMRRLRF